LKKKHKTSRDVTEEFPGSCMPLGGLPQIFSNSRVFKYSRVIDTQKTTVVAVNCHFCVRINCIVLLWFPFYAFFFLPSNIHRELPTPPQGVNTPNFRTTPPPASYLDNLPNISQEVLNIIFTFANFCMKFRYLILRKIIKLLPPDVRF